MVSKVYSMSILFANEKENKVIRWVFTGYMAKSKLKIGAGIFIGFLLFLLIVVKGMKGILAVYSCM